MSDPFKSKIPPTEKRSAKDFVAPSKEDATTGRYMQAGDYYGVGYRNPCGKDKASGLESGAIPQKTECRDPNEIGF
jgi:hypothetical protein